MIFLISASWVARITGMSHWQLATVRFFSFFFLSFFFFFFFFAVLGLELRAYTLSHSTSPFCDGYFRDRVSRTICPHWLQNSILLSN
jgi:hypothetical protein